MPDATRLDIDLTFSLAEPITGSVGENEADSSGESAAGGFAQMHGTVKASGTDVEIFASRPELLIQGNSAKLADLRILASELASRGLTVALTGPLGLIGRIGDVDAPLLQRLVTKSPHITLGSRAALAPLVKTRLRPTSGMATIPLPPPTLLPLVPTFDRRIKRRITTTHYARGAGRPRLIFVVGSENWNGQMPRQFELTADITTIGSAPESTLPLTGLAPHQAEVRHDKNDEYVLYVDGESTGRILRTGARIELGPWRMAFFREEYADHGRPHGGREGGELAVQKPQAPRKQG
jgi:hypothetical protein